MERLNIFNDINNKNGNTIKVLLGSDILIGKCGYNECSSITYINTTLEL